MPKRQKRFKSEKAILKAIDEVEALYQAALKAHEDLRDGLRYLTRDKFRTDEGWENGVGRHKNEILKAERRIGLYQKKKKRLGEALSQFKTLLLPMGVNDNSVVL